MKHRWNLARLATARVAAVATVAKVVVLAAIALVPASARAAAAAQTDQDTLQRNKEVARELFEVAIGRGDWNTYTAIHDPHFLVKTRTHDADLAEDLRWAKGWRSAFPDLSCKVLQSVAESDLVTARWSCTGTNTGTGNGLPATGKSFEGGGITILRLRDGRIQQEWSSLDELQVLQQLGLVPDNLP
jgi:steroid delta-isomerase-like uncharacterized protein